MVCELASELLAQLEIEEVIADTAHDHESEQRIEMAAESVVLLIRAPRLDSWTPAMPVRSSCY